MIYTRSLPDTALRQGELLSNVIQFVAHPDSIAHGGPGYEEVAHNYAFVVSQDCDLDWDYKSRTQPESRDRTIPNVLMCEAKLAADAAIEIMILEGSKNTNRSRIWPRARTNKDERYQFFSTVPADADLQGEGAPELVIDFKRYFTLPTGELYRWIALGETRRRCRLQSPYMEHLSSRFGYFLSRVALPEDYRSEPGVVRRQPV